MDNPLPVNFNYSVIDGSDKIINSNLTRPRERLRAHRFLVLERIGKF